MQLKLALLAAVIAAPSAAFADGEVTVRGAYYKERSTRVMQPMLDARFDAGDNAQVDAHFLLDAITSASAAAGATGTAFNEMRYEAGGAYSHELGRYGLQVGGRFSKEPDYTSRFANARVRADFAQRNTSVFLAGAVGFDSISNGSQQGGIVQPVTGDLTTVLGSLSVSQVLSPRWVVSATYDLSYLDGYQENPYRRVAAGGSLVPERVPEKRYRNAVAAAARGILPNVGTIFAASYRFYADSWGILAHTPEVRLTQPVSDNLFVQGRYRFHTQNAADFQRDVYDSTDVMIHPHLTDDAKLASMRIHTLGAKIDVAMGIFGIEGTQKDIRTEIAFDYLLQNNRFGNAIQGTLAVVFPFGY